MNAHRALPLTIVFALAPIACKSSSPPPIGSVPDLPVVSRAATPPENPSASPRSAIAALPRPDLALPPIVSGARAASPEPIIIGGSTSGLQSGVPPALGLDGGRADLVMKLVLRDGERSKDSHGRTMTVNLRAGHLVSETAPTGRLAATPPVRRAGDLSADDFAKIVAVLDAQRLAETESHVTDTTQHGRYVDVTLDVTWRGKNSQIRLAGMTRLAGSEAKTPFAEHPLSKRVAVLLTTLRRIIAGY